MKPQKGFTLIELMVVVAIIAILAAIAITQYQNYIARTQFVRVMNDASALRPVVEICILNGLTVIGTNLGQCDPQATGSNLLTGASQTGASLPANTGVPQVAINAGVTTIVATFGNNISAPLSAATLTWTRNSDGVWTCTSTANAKYKSSGCQ